MISDSKVAAQSRGTETMDHRAVRTFVRHKGHSIIRTLHVFRRSRKLPLLGRQEAHDETDMTGVVEEALEQGDGFMDGARGKMCFFFIRSAAEGGGGTLFPQLGISALSHSV